MPTQIRLSITLADGRVFSHVVSSMPRHWKSWLMQRCPYGTSFQGCSFARETVRPAFLSIPETGLRADR